MELIDQTKSILENLYYLSGILILISVLIGIIQLYLAKRTLNTNSRREAAKLAAEQVEIYMTRVIPLHNKLFHLETSQKFYRQKVEVGDFTIGDLQSKMGKVNYAKANSERVKVIRYSLSVMNAMEAFSVYFTKGVADEEIAFSSVGQTFVKSVDSLYFDIASCISDKEDKTFQNLRQLYKIWSERIKKDKLVKDHQSLSEQLQSIEDMSIRPIGTGN